MAATVLTLEEFAGSLATTAKIAAHEPVIVLESGEPAHVWLTYSAYQNLTDGKNSWQLETKASVGASGKTLADVFSYPFFDQETQDYEFPKMDIQFKPAEFD